MTAVLRMLSVKTCLESATGFLALAFLLFALLETGISQSAGEMGKMPAPLPSQPSAEFIRGFRGPWGGASFSPDGRSLVTAGQWSTQTVWDVASGQPRHFWLEGGALAALAFHPNSRWLALSSTDNKTIQLWDATTGSKIRSFNGHQAEVLAAMFLGDGSQLVSFDFNGALKFWETETGRELKSMQLDRAAGAVFSRNGELLATKSTGASTTKLWTVSSGRLLRVLPASMNMDHVMALNADATLLADAGDRRETTSSPGLREVNAIRVYDVTTGEERYRIPLTSKDYMLRSLTFSPDGRWLALGGYSTVRLWELKTGRLGFQADFGILEKTVTFSPDGQWLALSSRAGVTLCNIAVPEKQPDGKTILALRTDDADAIYALAFGNDDRRIASVNSEGIVRLWDVASKQVVRTLPGKLDLTARVQFSHNGKLLAGYGFGNTITLWDAVSGEELRKCKVAPKVGVAMPASAFSPDDRCLALAERGKAVLLDVATCNVVRELAPVVDPNDPSQAPKPGFVFDQVDFLAFNPEGHHLVLVVTNALQLWDVDAGHKLRELTFGPKRNSSYMFPAFSPDGHWLAVLTEIPSQRPRVGFDIQLIVYDAASLRERYKVPLADLFYGLSFNAEGDILLDADGVTEVREGATGKVLRSLPIPKSPLGTRVFSNHGRWLTTVGASGQSSNSIALWDLSTGERTATLTGMPVRSFSWDPNQ